MFHVAVALVLAVLLAAAVFAFSSWPCPSVGGEKTPSKPVPTAAPPATAAPRDSPRQDKVLEKPVVDSEPDLRSVSPALPPSVKQDNEKGDGEATVSASCTPPLPDLPPSRGSTAMSQEQPAVFMRAPSRSMSRGSMGSQRSSTTPGADGGGSTPKYEIGVVRFVNQSFGFIIRNTIELPKPGGGGGGQASQPNTSHAIFFNVTHVVDNLELARGDRVQYRVHYPRRTSSSRFGRRSSAGSMSSADGETKSTTGSEDGVVKEKAKAMDVTLIQRGTAAVKQQSRKSDVSTGALNWRRASADPGRQRRRSLPMSAMSPPRNSLLRQMRMEASDHLTHHKDATPKLLVRSPNRRSSSGRPAAGDGDADGDDEFVEFALHPLGMRPSSEVDADPNPANPTTPPRRHTTANTDFSRLRVDPRSTSSESATDSTDGPLAVVEVDGVAASPRDIVLSPTGSRRSKKWRRPSYPESMMMFLQKTDGRRDALDGGAADASANPPKGGKWRAGGGDGGDAGWRASLGGGSGAGAGAGVAVSHRRRSSAVRARKRVPAAAIEGSWRSTLKSP